MSAERFGRAPEAINGDSYDIIPTSTAREHSCSLTDHNIARIYVAWKACNSLLIYYDMIVSKLYFI
jgi:hypothetical protein